MTPRPPVESAADFARWFHTYGLSEADAAGLIESRDARIREEVLGEAIEAIRAVNEPTESRKEMKMDPKSGAIGQFETEEDAKLAGFTESLTGKEAGHLQGMNRQQRRAWLAEQRRLGKRAPAKLTDAERSLRVRALELELEELRKAAEE